MFLHETCDANEDNFCGCNTNALAFLNLSVHFTAAWRGTTISSRPTAFITDDAAWAAFRRTVEEEGMRAFLDQAVVIPFRR